MRHTVYKILRNCLPSDIARYIVSFLPSRIKKRRVRISRVKYRSGDRRGKRRSISFDFHHIR